MAGTRKSLSILRLLLVVAATLFAAGCAKPKSQQTRFVPLSQPAVGSASTPVFAPRQSNVSLVSHVKEQTVQEALPVPADAQAEIIAPPHGEAPETLAELESWALSTNPTLRRMQAEAASEWAKAAYADKLPDPSIGAMGFAPPMHFEPDRQLAEIEFMQMIPWLGRLRAEARQAQMEALAAENAYRAERLRVIGDLRANWFKLYVLGKQIETTEAEQKQLQSLIQTANARIAAGAAQPGDVLMATLEFSSLQEQLLGFRQQVAATAADINRLLGRDARTPITPPEGIDAELPAWSHDMLREIAFGSQPELTASQMRTVAAQWGIEVARLQRRPDLTFGATWMIMDAPGAMTDDAGMDSWVLGVATTLPIWHRKYDAMVSEATSRHVAAYASEEEVAARLDALLRDLWEQAVASQRTVQLYEQSILPQARQTFAADLQSLANNTVTFDRVIRDYRTLLNLELGYHRALGQLATALARIRQAVGVDLSAAP